MKQVLSMSLLNYTSLLQIFIYTLTNFLTKSRKVKYLVQERERSKEIHHIDARIVNTTITRPPCMCDTWTDPTGRWPLSIIRQGGQESPRDK